MLNLIVLMGRATKDPTRRLVNNVDITNFDITVDNLRKESDGSQSTSFFAVTCFGKVAENVAKFVKKGSKIAVQGSIQQRSYLTKDGEKRTTYDIIADSVEFLDPKPAEESKEVAPTPKFDPYTGKPLTEEKGK